VPGARSPRSRYGARLEFGLAKVAAGNDVVMVCCALRETPVAGCASSCGLVLETKGADARWGGSRLGLSSQKVTVTVGVYIFDLLYANGEVLVQLPLCERQERLKQVRHQICTGL
jgi:hypothetical protein